MEDEEIKKAYLADACRQLRDAIKSGTDEEVEGFADYVQRSLDNYRKKDNGIDRAIKRAS